MNMNSKKVSNYFLYLIFFCYACEGIAEQSINSVWPAISTDIKADISLIGILSTLVYIGSGIASLVAYKVRNKIGTNRTATLSMIFFSLPIIIYIFSKNFIGIAVGMFITGLGIGLNDVGADSYVIKAYDAKQDSILHSCWTIGAFLGTTILTFTLTNFSSYKIGFVIMLIIFSSVIILLILAKRNWERSKVNLDKELVRKHSVTEEEKNVNANIFEMLKTKNIIYILLCFGIVNAVSRSITVFIATIMVEQYGVKEIIATSAVGFFCLAGFIGRIIGSFIFDKIDLKSTLISGIIGEILILVFLFLNIFTGPMIVTLFIILGIFDSIQIPYIFSYAKECVGTYNLSALLGYGNALGLVLSIITTGIATVIIQKDSIKYIEIMYIVLLALLFLFLVSIKKNKIDYKVKEV